MSGRDGTMVECGLEARHSPHLRPQRLSQQLARRAVAQEAVEAVGAVPGSNPRTIEITTERAESVIGLPALS